ncbi:four helix bundle protein [Succinimonas amylolytica]|uniref:four helix bundle protein n=1 Tax=Succinimonas amylolytica TaxID=83769 RepID=UPI0023A86E76
MYRKKQQSELTVITRANELCSYIFTVTQKSPKQFRFTFTGRLQNSSLNVLEYLIRANETPLDRKQPALYAERVSCQRKAMTEPVIIGYLAVMAMEQKCLLVKQCEQISGLITDCRNLLGGWMISDKKRFRGEAVPVQDPAQELAAPAPEIF